MAASMFGKVKTCLQIAAILAVIAVHGKPLWVSALLYVAVARDRALGARLLLRHAPAHARRRERRAQARRLRATSSRARVEPLARGSSGAPRRRPRRSRRAAREQAVAFGDDVVLVDRLEVLLARRDEARPVQVRELARPRRRSSRARSPRRSAGGGAPFRPPRPRPSASSARRSPRTCSPRRSPAASLASISAAQSSAQPICSVARPRWLCVATGTLARIALDLLLAEALARRAARARAPATSSCAHGQAVMPVAETPTVRRVPCAKATARPCSV